MLLNSLNKGSVFMKCIAKLYRISKQLKMSFDNVAEIATEQTNELLEYLRTFKQGKSLRFQRLIDQIIPSLEELGQLLLSLTFEETGFGYDIMSKTEGVIEVPGDRERICKELLRKSKSVSEQLKLISGILGNGELVSSLIENLNAIIQGCKI